MKHFGTVKSFDASKGIGSITPEAGGEELTFERSAFSWSDNKVPTTGQRLSYDPGQVKDNRPTALNLQTI